MTVDEAYIRCSPCPACIQYDNHLIKRLTGANIATPAHNHPHHHPHLLHVTSLIHATLVNKNIVLCQDFITDQIKSESIVLETHDCSKQFQFAAIVLIFTQLSLLDNVMYSPADLHCL